MSGFNVGDRVSINMDRAYGITHLEKGDKATIVLFLSFKTWKIKLDKDSPDSPSYYMLEKFMAKIDDQDEEEPVTARRNFRNGDIIKVRPRKGDTAAWVKFGDLFYNLNHKGQMKGSKYLPQGQKEVIGSLVEMGPYFLMTPEQMESELRKEQDKLRKELDEDPDQIPF